MFGEGVVKMRGDCTLLLFILRAWVAVLFGQPDWTLPNLERVLCVRFVDVGEYNVEIFVGLPVPLGKDKDFRPRSIWAMSIHRVIIHSFFFFVIQWNTSDYCGLWCTISKSVSKFGFIYCRVGLPFSKWAVANAWDFEIRIYCYTINFNLHSKYVVDWCLIRPDSSFLIKSLLIMKQIHQRL